MTVISMSVAFAILSIVALVREPPKIEGRILAAAEQALRDSELNAVRVTVSGRDVKVKGSVRDGVSRQTLADIVDSVTGVREFLDETATGEDHVIQLVSNGRRLTLKGVTPDDRTQEILTSYARQVFGRFRVSDETALIERDIDLGWPNTVRYLIEVSQELGPSIIAITDLNVKVVPELASPEALSAISVMKQTLNPRYTVVVDTTNTFGNLSATECLSRILRALVAERIEFVSGSAQLELAHSIRTVDVVGRLVERCPDADFEVVGHTDSTGNEESNRILSQQRAEAVVERLVQNGVDPGRLRAIGRGSAEPISDNETPDGKAANRRIEFKLVVDKL